MGFAPDMRLAEPAASGGKSTMGNADKGNREGDGSPLRRVIHYLAHERIPQRVARENLLNRFKHRRKTPQTGDKNIASVNQLALALGYRNHSSLYPANDKLPDETEFSIRALYGIGETSECWKYFGKRDVEGFIAAYEALYASQTGKKDEIGSGALVRTSFVPLQWDASAEPKSESTRYASLALRTGNSPTDPLPGQIHLGLDLHCPEDRTDTLVTGLKRCVLIFDCGGGHTGPLSERTGRAGGETFDGACFSTFGTSITEPVWEIIAIGPGGIGKVESVPATFILIDGLRPGSAVTARIRAPVKEILTTFVVPEGAAQSAAKRKIKARLEQLGIVGGETGEADLATGQIVLMAKPGAAEPEAKG
jgi:hypothetical protein